MHSVLRYFKFAIEHKLLKFELDPVKANYSKGGWLTVSYHETLSATGKDWRWSLLCAQDTGDYMDTEGNLDSEKLIIRITLMLAEQLRSKQQDVNILMTEK